MPVTTVQSEASGVYNTEMRCISFRRHMHLLKNEILPVCETIT